MLVRDRTVNTWFSPHPPSFLPAILLPSSYPHGRLDDVIDKAYTPGKVVAPKK